LADRSAQNKDKLYEIFPVLSGSLMKNFKGHKCLHIYWRS
jgi:hypothetical protein